MTVGQMLVDRDGNEIGKITDVISDPVTIKPEWLTVRIGYLGGEHLVPVRAVETSEHGPLVVPFGKDRVKSAPRVKHHAGPERNERRALYEHYGLQVPAAR